MSEAIFSVTRRRLKGLESERGSDQRTPKAGYTHYGPQKYLMQIKFAFPFFPCHDTFNYITLHKQVHVTLL